VASEVVLLTGKLAKLADDDASRVAVYLVRGDEILSSQQLDPSGALKMPVAAEAAVGEPTFGLELVVGPAGMRGTLGDAPELQRVPIEVEKLRAAKGELKLSLEKVKLTKAILERWWLWCSWYCVSGQVIGRNGCPVPFADVTVNTVDFALTTYAATTVTTDADGKFSACFPWCGDRCWPCWPFWWRCWPWWWELDLLHVIEHIEQPVVIGPPGPGPVEAGPQRIALSKPSAPSLASGQAFAAARPLDARLEPDEARTKLIARKLSNPAIQRIFPWWWWCCDDPNICFTVRQGGTIVLDEDAATATRWCLEEGSQVTLVAGDLAVTTCAGDPKPLHGFLWTRVGNTTVDTIHEGYADGSLGTRSSDLAFWAGLDIYGEFAPSSNVACYQVNAQQWNADPARGGVPVGMATPISAPLYNQVVIWHQATNTVTFDWVKMGPFSQGGLSNLYFTQDQRAAQKVGFPPDIPPFPAYAAGDAIVWSFEGRKVDADASALVAGGANGGTTLSVTGYSSAFALQSLTSNPDDHLTLLVDNSSAVSTARINSLHAFNAGGTEVLTSGGSTDCPAYDVGPGGYIVLNVTVTDANAHLEAYVVETDFGHGSSGTASPGERDYQPPDSFPAGYAGPPNTTLKAFAGGTEDITFHPTVDCCYDFRLNVAKRVTNGSGSPGFYTPDFWTATIKVSS
jgi:hypothetical protein